MAPTGWWRQPALPQPQSGPQPEESPVLQLQLAVTVSAVVPSLLAAGLAQPHEQVLLEGSVVTSEVSVVVKVFSPPLLVMSGCGRACRR